MLGEQLELLLFIGKLGQAVDDLWAEPLLKIGLYKHVSYILLKRHRCDVLSIFQILNLSKNNCDGARRRLKHSPQGLEVSLKCLRCPSLHGLVQPLCDPLVQVETLCEIIDSFGSSRCLVLICCRVCVLLSRWFEFLARFCSSRAWLIPHQVIKVRQPVG